MFFICPRCNQEKEKRRGRICNTCSNKRTATKRNKLFEQGLCTECGKNKLVEGRRRCRSCLDNHRSLKLIGLCSDCNKRDVVPGRCQCQQCIDTVKRRLKKKRLLKICRDCSEPTMENHVFCKYHLIKRKEQARNIRIERLLQGLCVSHKSRPVAPSSKYYCVQCLEYKSKNNKEFKQKMKDKGLCTTCAKPTGSNRVSCERCIKKIQKSRGRRLKLATISANFRL